MTGSIEGRECTALRVEALRFVFPTFERRLDEASADFRCGTHSELEGSRGRPIRAGRPVAGSADYAAGFAMRNLFTSSQ